MSILRKKYSNKENDQYLLFWLTIIIALALLGCHEPKFNWASSGYKQEWVYQHFHTPVTVYESKTLVVYEYFIDMNPLWFAVYTKPEIEWKELRSKDGVYGCIGKGVFVDARKCTFKKIKNYLE